MRTPIPDRSNFPGRQGGYVLVLVSVFLLILAGTSAQFYLRAVESTSIAGSMRDNAEAVLLAESAMHTLMGRFSISLDTNNDTIPDAAEAGVVQLEKADPTAVLFPYMFYVSTTQAIETESPGILQRVANGEALASGGGT